MHFDTVYWNRLRKMLSEVRAYMPINVINAGIGGITAKQSVPLLDNRVLKHEPDLVIVCFGLNDVNCEKDEYLSALSEIFNRIKAQGTDVIFMTPNMLNTYVDKDTELSFKQYAYKTADMQNSGKMDDYIYSAKALAESMDIPVADCYTKWRELEKTQDTTKQLINKINHPNKEMHALFAEELFKIIMPEEAKDFESYNTMYE